MKTKKSFSISLAMILIFMESHIAHSRYAKHKKVDKKESIAQKLRNKPNIFLLFDGMSEQEIADTINNIQFKNILDRIDGIKLKHKNKKRTSAESLKKPKDLRSFISAITDTSNSTSSSESSENDEVDKFINEKFKSAYSLKDEKESLAEVIGLLSAAMKNYTKGIQDTNNYNKNVYDDVENDLTEKSILRLGNSCNKGASKACATACKSVLKGVCDEYKCSSGLKSRFKSECKRNCRNRFIAD